MADSNLSVTRAIAPAADSGTTTAAVQVATLPDRGVAPRSVRPDDEAAPWQPPDRFGANNVAVDSDSEDDDRFDDEDAQDDGDSRAADALMRRDAGAFTPPRRTVDADVMAVLRDEADREARARRAETEPPAAVAPRYAPPTGRVPRSAGASVAARVDAGEAHSRASRSNAVPGNAFAENGAFTDSVGYAGFPEQEFLDPGRRRSGFATGFLVVLVVTALLAGAYLAAPAISTQFPAADFVLQRYVSFVDAARSRLDAAAQDAMVLFAPPSVTPASP